MSDSLNQYIKSVEHLPSPPAVVIQLIATFREPYADVDEVANLLSQDQSLTAEVLRHCNSGYLGSEAPTVDIFDAIIRMGYYEVYQTAVTALSRQTMRIQKPIGTLQPNEYWRHSGATAVFARLLARLYHEEEGIAYTAGLLHDIGKMVLALAENEKYTFLMGHVGSFGRELVDAERATFGFGHATIGGRLLEMWNVPTDIAQLIASHHDPVWDGPNARLSAIVSLSDALAHHLDTVVKKDKPFELPGAEPAIETLKIKKIQLEVLIKIAREEMKDLASPERCRI